MKILRDIRLSTKLLILLELLAQPDIKLRELAAKLDITIQGTSEYLKRMCEENLVVVSNGRHIPTKKGIQFLHDNFISLRNFVGSAMKRLWVIESCAAIARTKIRRGDKVGLFMEHGLLVGYANRTSSSVGIAMDDAKPGDDFCVTNLEGLVTLTPGRLQILEVPSVKDGGSRRVAFQELRNIICEYPPELVCAYGTESIVLTRRAKLGAAIRFAPVEVAVEACQRGLDVLLLVSSDLIQEAITKIDEYNAMNLEKIRYTIFHGYRKGA